MLNYIKLYFLLFSICLVTACGGGSGGGSLAGAPGGSGTGGTGIAAITGFSSIILNDDRVFTVGSNTQLFIDGTPVSEAALNADGLGLMARFNVATDVDNSISSGTLLELNAENSVKGPVTSINPLQILGQTLVVTGDSVLVGLSNVSSLNINDIVEASGFGDSNNSLQSTRIQLKPAGTAEWKILGNVSNVTAGSFTMGSQQVNLNGVVPRDCGAGLSNGNVVEVKATPDPAFSAGNPLTSVTDVECRNLALSVSSPSGSTVFEAEVEGIVTSLTAQNDFIVRQQRVVTTAGTVFEGGSAEDILLGARLEAEGTLNISTGTLTAERIRFRQNRVRIEAPVNVPSAGLGISFTIMDVITVNTNSLTEDDDGLISGSGSAGNQQVEVRGFVDSNNQVFAERVRERGTADPNDVRLRGPANDTCDPSSGDDELAILGVIVDTGDSGTLFEDSRNSSSVSLPDNTALCNLISIGTSVQAEDGVFNSSPARIDNAGEIEIED